jgi:hypothetical protein
LDFRFAGDVVGVGCAESRLLLDLLLQFFSFLALEESSSLDSLLLLDFLEIQQAEVWEP